MDINGDGLPDRVSNKNYATGALGLHAMINETPNPVIESITTGLGKTTSIDYKPLTDTSVYTKGTGATYPEVDYAGSSVVVSAIHSSNGLWVVQIPPHTTMQGLNCT